MKLASLRHDGRVIGAVVDGDTAYPLPVSVGELVQLGLERALEIGAAATEGIPFDPTALELPYRPASIRDFVTFESHVEGVRRSIDHAVGVPEAWYDAPTFYFTNPHALFGPGAPIPRPPSCNALDFELEVGVVLGRGGTSLTEAQAQEAIFGYTIFNDWSARDLQAREMQVGLGPAKGKDFASSIGPWIVTADELPSLDLDCRVFVNDELIGQDNLSHMHWSFAQMIAYASRDSVVLAGDLLASGTTGGGGCLAELWGRNGSQTPPALQPGDRVTMAVDCLGVLEGSVA
ncbi:Fumarylacetoacetase [metagenome]|uniref:Fumarylacetoacetase n=1 Tax=metagenome TaxID=256318 RepID=A0A2P2CBM8_9ZZZZ